MAICSLSVTNQDKMSSEKRQTENKIHFTIGVFGIIFNGEGKL